MHRCLFILAAVAALGAWAGSRVVESLDFGWSFALEGSDTVMVDLPHDFQIGQPWVAPSADERPDLSDGAANVKSRLSARGYKEIGQGTYTRTLAVPADWRGRRVLLDFGGIMLTGDVYYNGRRVGGTDYGYLGFEVDITPWVRWGETDTLTVTCSTGQPLNSRWYTGGGLYRSVKMVATDAGLHFNRHGLQVLTPVIEADSATVSVVGDITAAAPIGEFEAEVVITDPDGAEVARAVNRIAVDGRWRVREYPLAELQVPNPRLWDCDTPNLYCAHVALRRADGTEADRLDQTFGIRTVEFSPQYGMRLNGKPVILKGIANHHTLGALGAAAYPRALEKRIRLLKEFGFNHIRTSHNPYSQEFLDLCDRYGMLVVDELYDKWLQQYSGGRVDWTQQWQRDIPEWVRRDRNHPSVVIWSLGNELQGYNNLPYNDWGVTAYRLQKTLLERYDATRPVTVAMHPRVRSLDTDSLPAPLALETDIAAYNYRYMYFPGDARRFPGLIFYQSEANLAYMGPNYFVPLQQPGVIGLAYWGMIDYLGESLGWPAKGWTDGVFDISLDPKPNAWLLRSMFVDEPVVKLGVSAPGGRLTDWNGIQIGGERVVDSWNHAEGDTLRVWTYTNADSVALRLNGNVLGVQVNDRSAPDKRNKIAWERVPYRPGMLVAEAYVDGRIATRDTLATASEAVRLVAVADLDDWQADGMDLQHVNVTAVDSHGRRVPDAQVECAFSVEGPATLIATSSGDMTSDEVHTSPTRRLHQGRAMAILRAGRQPGPVTLTITAPGFDPVRLPLTLHMNHQ